MSLRSCYTGGRPGLSFELFPPRTEVGVRSLDRHVRNLMAFSPDFITCTFGAGGSTRDKTLEIVCQIKQQFKIPVASHLTVVDATREQLTQYLDEARANGVDYIVALRGDPPSGRSFFQAAPGGLRYANELVSLIRDQFPGFGIAVAGYPETHQEAPDARTDLDNLKRKVDAGADVVITQLFYDNQDFFRFLDRCRAAGIEVPIVPGILPVLGLNQVKKITALCGAKLPSVFADRLARKPDDPEWQMQVGIEHATDQASELLSRSADGLHFYVLNKSRSAAAILSSLQNLRLSGSQRR